MRVQHANGVRGRVRQMIKAKRLELGGGVGVWGRVGL